MSSYERRTGWHGRVVRCLAVFFVLFTFADLAFAHCIQHDQPGGSHPVADGSATAAAAAGELALAISASDSDPEQSSEAVCNDECCFCCARVLLGASTVARTPTSGSRAVLTFYVHDSPLTPFLSGTFRPPRNV